MLLGSTTAKVLNDADCPILTLQLAETITNGKARHCEIACSIRLDAEGLRVLRYASRLARSMQAHLSIIHVVPGNGSDTPTLFGEARDGRRVEVQEARRRIDELQRSADAHADIHVAVGGVK